MTLYDLPPTIQDSLRKERLELSQKWYRNTSYEVCFVNAEGTRYFRAIRKQSAYTDDKGNYMPFGGGSVWNVSYGKILWDRKKQPLGGDYDYFWVMSGKTFTQSTNGTVIPKTVGKKSEVINIAKEIGTLVI